MVLGNQAYAFTASFEESHDHPSKLFYPFNLLIKNLNINGYKIDIIFYMQPKREAIRRIPQPSALIPTTISAEIEPPPKKPTTIHQPSPVLSIIPKQEKSSLMAELDWDLNLEYDPLHPSDYDKIIRGLKRFKEQ